MSSLRRLSILPALALVAAAPPASEIPRIDHDVVYGMYSGLALLLDVAHPAQPNGFAVLQIPGSGFQAPLTWDTPQLKDSLQPATDALVRAGFTVFTINYRQAPRFRYPAPVEDAQLAARFIRSNAARFGVRPDRLAVLGGSSGGNLAAMLATIGEGGPAQPSSERKRPDCVVAVMAPMDLVPIGLNGAATGYVVSYIGHPPPYGLPGEAESFGPDYAQASPQTHISGQMSPMLLLHGDKDPLVPYDQSTQFFRRAQDAGGHVQLVTMTGVGHRFMQPYVDIAVNWLTGCMKQKP